MFRCKDLLTLPTMSRAKLVAGASGLDNGIRWSYKAENMNFASWVHGQELLIVSSPVINSENYDLHELVKEAIRLNLSGILLLVGENYVSSISRKTIKLADDNYIPIITLPGTVPLVDIFEELGHAIVYHDKTLATYEDLLAGIVFGNQLDEKAILGQAKLLSYEITKPQRIFMVHVNAHESNLTHGQMTILNNKLQSLFEENKVDLILSRFNYNLVGLTGEASEEKIDKTFESFIREVNEENPGISFKIGIGSRYKELSLIRKSFSEASTCLEFAKPIQWYERIGFLRVLLSMENQDLLDEYMNQVLGKLIDHDKTNGTQLLDTLQSYFTANENMKEAGNIMFMHPNTIKYRIRQIQEMTGYNLDSSKDKLELQNALMIWEIRKMKDLG